MGEFERDIGLASRLPSREAINEALLADERPLVETLIAKARLNEDERVRIEALAVNLVEAARAGRRASGRVDSLLHEYGV